MVLSARRRLALRGLLVVLVVMIGLVTLPLLALQFAVVRGHVLGRVVETVAASLPGELVVRQAAWPRTSHLRLQDVSWTVQDDTLAAMPRLELRWDNGSLLRRHLRVPLLHVVVARLDLPRIQATLQAAAGAEAVPPSGDADAAAGVPWLRTGSVRGVPSLTVEDLQVDVRHAALTDSTAITSLQLGLRADLRVGTLPRVSLQPLRLKMHGPDVEIVEGNIEVDLQTGRLQVVVRSSSSSPWRVTAMSRTDDPDALGLQVHVTPPEGPSRRLLRIEAALHSGDDRVQGMRLQARVDVPDVAVLRRIAPLQQPLQAVPDLRGPQLDLTGDVMWWPHWRVDLLSRWQAPPWLQPGGCRVVQHGDTLRLEDVVLQLRDLGVEARGQRVGSVQQADVRARIQGSRWLQDLAPGVPPPGELDVDLWARLAPSDHGPRWQAQVRAAVRRDATRIEDLLLQAHSVTTLHQARFHLQSRLQGWDVTVGGQATVDDSLLVQLDPIVLRQSSEERFEPLESLPEPRDPTRVAWHAQRGVRVEDLQVTGDLGRVQARGQWTPQGDARVSIRADWPRPPEAFLAAITADSLQRRMVQEAWPTSSSPLLEVSARAQQRQGGMALWSTGSFVLPGPRLFAYALPESLRLQDLDVLRGSLEGELAQDSITTTWSARVDLSQTAWLDSTAVHVRAVGDSFHLESLRLLWEGLDVRMSGSADTTQVALEGSLRWQASRWLQRLPQAQAAASSLSARARWHIRGRPSAPDIDATLHAAVATPWAEAKQLEGSVNLRQGTLRRAEILAPAGLQARDLAWERVRATLTPGGSPDALSSVSVELLGGTHEVRAALRLDMPEATRILGDSLALRLAERDMVTTRPFIIRRSATTTVLEDLDLQGSLGTLSAQAIVSADTLALQARAALHLPPVPERLEVPVGLWPRDLQLRVAAAGNDSCSLFLQADGLQLAERPDLSLRCRVVARPDSTSFALEIAGDDDTLVVSHGLVPLDWTLRPLAFALRPDSLALELALLDFPLPDVFEDPGAAFDVFDRSTGSGGSRLNGRIRVEGSLQAPRALGQLRLQPQDPELADYRVHAFLALHQERQTWGAELQRQLDRLATAEVLRPPGAKLAFWVEHDTTRVLDAAVHVPLQVGFRDGSLHIESDASLRAALKTRNLQLADFNALLPARASVGGVLSIDLGAEGPWKDPALEGGLRFTELAVAIPDGSRVRASGNVQVQGPVSDPGVQGTIKVRDGLIRIPELPRALLPTEGDALLLSASAVVADSATARPGATATTRPAPAAASDNTTPAASTRRAPRRTVRVDSLKRVALPVDRVTKSDSDVFLEIPGAFWIRGRGFEVELSGNLHLTMRQGRIRIVGELKAERGGLQLLASKFPIKTGRVIFYGDDETNPSLDLVMGRNYDGVTVEVVVQGTAKDPDIDFRSDPALSEDEILSYVLFGRGRSNLDETQASQFDERTLALASILTTNLGEGIREQTGVDMIGLEQSQETADRASLVVGKYLSPRVLLKYVQDLERGRGFAVNVEYWLRGGLRLMTTTSRYNESGLELNWSHEY